MVEEIERGQRQSWHPSGLLWVSAAWHVAALAALALAPGQWRRVAGAVFANHVVLAAAGMAPRSRLLGPNLVRLPTADAGNDVALTFDDGPDAEVTPRVLDILARHGARATFFCIGKKAERRPDLVGEIVARGHLVENHTYSHSNLFAFFGPRGVAREIDRAQQVLEAAGGRRPVYVRVPAGIRSPWLEPVLARRGLRLVSWTRRGFDTVERDPERVSRRLCNELAAGDVLLLHDGSAAVGRAGKPVVLEALERLLAALQERGLEAGSLPAEPSEA